MPCGEPWKDPGRHSSQELLNRFIRACRNASNCELERDKARPEDRDRDADLWCRRAEHHRAWATRFKNELRRRGIEPDDEMLDFFDTLADVS
jgi:hypothetical protein